MIRRPPRSTLSSSSAASDVYKRQLLHNVTSSSAASLHLSFNLRFAVVFTAAVCGLRSVLITLDFREPAGCQPSRCSLPALTQVSRHTIAVVTMLVNGLTRLGTTNDGTTEHGAATLCRRVAVYSGPFRRHEMTVVEIIIAVLHCRMDGVLACVYSCTISSNI